MEPYIAQIVMFGGNFAPRGWAFCDGQLLAINQNTALYSLLGTTFGGDGRTTFALPELRGRVAIHAGSGTGPALTTRHIGVKGGRETHYLTISEMPSHNHTASLGAEGGAASTQNPTGNLLGAGNFYTPPTGATPNRIMSAEAVTVNNNGQNQTHNNMQPYIAVNYIIALFGIYPPRN